ncbi:MAG: hypothetical protein ACOY0S_04380 [Patescibacteria group bacterium]
MSSPDQEKPGGSVFGGAFSEAAAFVRKKVAAGELTPEEGLALTEQAYKQVMLEQLMGMPQPERPEELPEDGDLF